MGPVTGRGTAGNQATDRWQTNRGLLLELAFFPLSILVGRVPYRSAVQGMG